MNEEPKDLIEILAKSNLLRRYGLCPVCKKKVGPFKDDLSYKEFKISGLCQGCQDYFFDQEE